MIGMTFRRSGKGLPESARQQITKIHSHHLANLAHANTAKLLALLYLQDIFWLLASRLQIATGQPFYDVSEFEWLVFLTVATLTLFSHVLAWSFAKFCLFFARFTST